MRKNYFLSNVVAVSLVGAICAGNAAADHPECDAAIYSAGGEVTASVLKIEVDSASLLGLEWEHGAKAEVIECDQQEALTLDRSESRLVAALEEAGTFAIRFSSGEDLVEAQARARIVAAEIHRDFFWVELEDRRISVARTSFTSDGIPAMKEEQVTDPDPPFTAMAPGILASFFELREQEGKSEAEEPSAWLASVAISSWHGRAEKRLAQRLGVSAGELTSAWIEKAHRAPSIQNLRRNVEQVTDPDPPQKVEQVTDPDPPQKVEQVTDPDPPQKEEQVTDPDPPLTAGEPSGQQIWRALVANGDRQDGIVDHLDTLAWLTPLVWPEVERHASSGSPRLHLVSYGLVD